LWALPSALLGRCFITFRNPLASSSWVTVLWPTGLILIVTYGHEHDLFGYTVTAISIVLNIVLYAAAVMVLLFIVWIVRRVAIIKR
jgi:hypothetical protein